MKRKVNYQNVKKVSLHKKTELLDVNVPDGQHPLNSEDLYGKKYLIGYKKLMEIYTTI